MKWSLILFFVLILLSWQEIKVTKASNICDFIAFEVNNKTDSKIKIKDMKDQQEGIINEEDDFLKQLHTWCLEDVGCRRAFFQENKRNFTIFKILLGDYFKENEISESFALSNILCNNETNGNITILQQQFWVLQLKHSISNRAYPIICDINHRLIFDSETLAFDCQCLPNRPCNDYLYPLDFFWILVVLGSLLVVLVLIGLIYRSVQVLRFVGKAKLDAQKKRDIVKTQTQIQEGIKMLNESIL